MGILGMLVAGLIMVAFIWSGGGVPPAEKSRLPVERGTPTLAEVDLALSLNPDYREGYEKRAELRFKQGDLTGASADIDAAIRLSPNTTSLLLLRAEIRKHLEEESSPATLPSPP